MVDCDKILNKLDTKVLQPQFILLDRVESTNSVAKQHVLDGVNEGTVVIAESQTKGRGRYDRVWQSPSGGLYLSLVMKPHINEAQSPLLGLLVANASACAIMKMGTLQVRLKWPNDIMINRRKAGGILSELVTKDDKVSGIIVGIGVNQNSRREDLPKEIAESTTTLFEELCVETSREELVCRLICEVDRRLIALETTRSFEPTLVEYRCLCDTIGRNVRIEQETEVIEGTAVDVDETGALLVKTSDGEVAVSLGDVFHLE